MKFNQILGKPIFVLAFLSLGLVKLADPPLKIYQDLIRLNTNHSSVQHSTGPDRANMRDFLMTVDLKEGRVPRERLVELKHAGDHARTESRNFNWEVVPTEISGRTRCFYWDEPNNVLWSGAVTGGLWKNEDFKNDANWQPVADLENVPVSCIAVDPQDTNVMFLGTGESYTAILNYRESSSAGSGIWKSVDGGLSWINLSTSSDFAYINDIVVRVENERSILYAAVGSGLYHDRIFNSIPDDGLYRSGDGGQTWEQVSLQTGPKSVSYMVSDIELTSSNRLIIGTMRNLSNESGGQILYSDDGEDWSIYADFNNTIDELTLEYGFQWYPGRVVLESADGNPDRVYAIFMAGYENAFSQIRDYVTFLKQSFDGGLTWTDLPLPSDRWSNIPWHAAAITIDPNNENKIVIGALNMYSLEDASNELVTELSWTRLTNWDGIYAYHLYDLEPSERDSLIDLYVHADIHLIDFLNPSSDEMLIATDGGLFYTNEMTKTGSILGDVTDQYPSFVAINNHLTTTQYYTVALDPRTGSDNFLGGTQDNGTLFNSENFVDYKSLVSGGDGAFCFFDEDNPEIFITSVYSNYYSIFNQGELVDEIWIQSGLFINPCDYDSRSNLLYANMIAGPEGGLYTWLDGRFNDSLLVINVNAYVGTNAYEFGAYMAVPLNAGISEPLTALSISPYSNEDEATLFAASNYGKVYRIEGLPYSAYTSRIDNGQLPVGYISSLDIGSTESTILLTYSNYGLESVWLTKNGGGTWKNIEYNLPDIPIRWGIFNPEDDRKIMLATEFGVWGLENTESEAPNWINYNEGMPEPRVDMIKVRKSDSTIIAATHGRGMYLGKYDQGEKVIVSENEQESTICIFPNPVRDLLSIKGINTEAKIKLINLEGKILVDQTIQQNRELNVSMLPRGLYVVRIGKRDGTLIYQEKLLKH